MRNIFLQALDEKDQQIKILQHQLVSGIHVKFKVIMMSCTVAVLYGLWKFDVENNQVLQTFLVDLFNKSNKPLWATPAQMLVPWINTWIFHVWSSCTILYPSLICQLNTLAFGKDFREFRVTIMCWEKYYRFPTYKFNIISPYESIKLWKNHPSGNHI